MEQIVSEAADSSRYAFFHCVCNIRMNLFFFFFIIIELIGTYQIMSSERQQQPPIRLAQTTAVYKQLMKMVVRP